MIKDGQEWFGFGFMTDDGDPNEVERQFVENIQYLAACQVQNLQSRLVRQRQELLSESTDLRRLHCLFDRCLYAVG